MEKWLNSSCKNKAFSLILSYHTQNKVTLLFILKYLPFALLPFLPIVTAMIQMPSLVNNYIFYCIIRNVLLQIKDVI